MNKKLITFFAFICVIIAITCAKAQQNSNYKFLVEKTEAVKEPPEFAMTEFIYDTDNKLIKSITTSHFFEQGNWRDGKSITVFEYENGRISKTMYTDSTHLLCNSCDEHYFYNTQGQLIRNESYHNGVYYRHLNFHYQNGLMVSTYTDNSYPLQYDTLFYDNSGNVVKRSLGGWREYHYEYDNNPKLSFGIDYLFLYPPPPAQATMDANLAIGLSKNNMTKTYPSDPNAPFDKFNYTYNEYGMPETVESMFIDSVNNFVRSYTISITYKQVEVGISEPKTELFDIKVFPNPTTGKLTIEWTSGQVDEWTSIEVFDVFGRKLIEQKAEGRRQKEIDITEFSLGVYFVKITTEKGVIVKKVVKQ